MGEVKLPLGRAGELHLGASGASWDSSIFDRPVFCAFALGRAMFGFTANVIYGSPLLEVYLGWPSVWVYWDRDPEEFVLSDRWK